MAVNRPQLAIFISPLIPDADAVFLEVLDIGITLQKPQQLMDDRAQVQLLGCEEREALRQVEPHLVTEHAERARAGEGPTLLEFRTYRYKGHSMSDPAKYRTKEELEDYKGRDSIEAVKSTILVNEWATEEELNQIDEKIKQVVAESVQFAEDSPYPDPAELYTDIYVEKDYPYIMD
mgnify:CR=1 FL=1